METSEVDSEGQGLHSLSKSGRPVRNKKKNPHYFDDTLVSGGYIRKAKSRKSISVVSPKQEPVVTYDNSEEPDNDNAYPPFINEEGNVQPFLDLGEGVSTVSEIPTDETMQSSCRFFNELCKGKSHSNTKRQKRDEVKIASREKRGSTTSLKFESKKKSAAANNRKSKQDMETHSGVKEENNMPMSLSKMVLEPSDHHKGISNWKTKWIIQPSKGKRKYVCRQGNRSKSGSRTSKNTDKKRKMDREDSFAHEQRRNTEVIRSQILSPAVASSSFSAANVCRIREGSFHAPNFPYRLAPGLMGTSHFPYFSDSDEKRTEDKTARELSFRLKNFLRLPKAFTWVYYEFFYSDIDKVLFGGDNDFQLCLKEFYSDLHTRKMTRAEWSKIRRMFGKVRRCSPKFFEQERLDLAKKRQKVRMVQQRKFAHLDCSSLPDQIPLMLTIGTKVSARLRKPVEGIYNGTVEGMDASDNSYRINFDRPQLGSHSILDYEVFSIEPPEMVPTSSIAMKIPRAAYDNFKFQNAFFLGESGSLSTARLPMSQFPLVGMLGGFPIQFLVLVVRFSKLLKAKREKVSQFKELNAEGEKMRACSKPFDQEYRIKYARCIIDLESMGKEIAVYLSGIQRFCLGITADNNITSNIIVPEDVQDQCKQEAQLLVDTGNSTEQNIKVVQNPNSLALITNLSSILLQIQMLKVSAGDRKPHEMKSIKDTLKEIKASLVGTNVQFFQDKIEIPITRIQAGLCVPKAH